MQETPLKSVTVAVVILRKRAGEYQTLLLRRTRSLAGEWCQIAGSLEQGETAWRAALREMKEETGLEPTAFYSADMCEQFYEVARNVILLAPVFIGFVASDAKVRLNAEHSEYCWVGLDEALKKLPFAGQRKIMKQVFEEFVEAAPNPWLRVDLEPRDGAVSQESF